MKTYISKLLREALLNEISSEQAWEAYYSDVNKFPALRGNKELFLKLDSLYPKKSNQHNRGVFMWLYNMLRSGLKEEDFYKVKEYVDLFNKYINRIPKEKRDITRYKTIHDLLDVVRGFRDAESSGEEVYTSKSDEIKNRRANELRLVYESDRWKVYIPLTEWASCEIGKGTEWCTAATKSDNRFDQYNNDGPLYVLINNEDGDKYQLHFPTDQFMDSNDRLVNGAYFFDFIAEDEGLYDFLKGESDTFYGFILATSAESADGYSETLIEALNNANKESVEYSEALQSLRQSEDTYARYLGFIYEEDVDNIDTYEVMDLIDNASSFENDEITRIINHLNSIGFDFEDSGLINYGKYLDDLMAVKLDIGVVYRIDKGRKLEIKGINFKDHDRPYKIILYDKNDKPKTGSIDLEGLKAMVRNLSLFENKNDKK